MPLRHDTLLLDMPLAADIDADVAAAITLRYYLRAIT